VVETTNEDNRPVEAKMRLIHSFLRSVTADLVREEAFAALRQNPAPVDHERETAALTRTLCVREADLHSIWLSRDQVRRIVDHWLLSGARLGLGTTRTK